MSKLSKSLMLLVVFGINALTTFAQDPNPLHLEIASKKEITITALTERDYRGAKLHVAELLPLLKRNLKEIERQLKVSKKEQAAKQVVKELSHLHKSNVEIYNSLKHVMEVSPAALRVQGAGVIAKLRNYQPDVVESELLASGN